MESIDRNAPVSSKMRVHIPVTVPEVAKIQDKWKQFYRKKFNICDDNNANDKSLWNEIPQAPIPHAWRFPPPEIRGARIHAKKTE